MSIIEAIQRAIAAGALSDQAIAEDLGIALGDVIRARARLQQAERVHKRKIDRRHHRDVERLFEEAQRRGRRRS